MQDQVKSKEQLIDELIALRERNAELEAVAIKNKQWFSHSKLLK